MYIELKSPRNTKNKTFGDFWKPLATNKIILRDLEHRPRRSLKTHRDSRRKSCALT